MSRIRTIKPEFFLDDELAELPFVARLLFIGLWTESDRLGRLEDRPKRLKAAILPYDDVDVDALLWDLHREGFIIRFEADGEDYISVPTFDKHQRPHPREADSVIPAASEGSPKEAPKHNLGDAEAQPRSCLSGEKSKLSQNGSEPMFPTSFHGGMPRHNLGAAQAQPRSAGREGKGRERKGSNTPLSPPTDAGGDSLFAIPSDAEDQDASGPLAQLDAIDPTRTIREASKASKAKPKAPSPNALRVLERMAELSGCRYGYSAALEARLRAGVPVEDCLAVVEHLALDSWWVEKRFGNSEAPFRSDKFADYLAKARAAPPPSSGYGGKATAADIQALEDKYRGWGE